MTATRGTAGRVEVVPSATRWEAVHVGARYPLARGRETQIDRARNALFYRSGFSGGDYRDWLRTNAVAFVASVVRIGVDRIVLRDTQPAAVLLRVRWSCYWDAGPGVCIARRADGYRTSPCRAPAP